MDAAIYLIKDIISDAVYVGQTTNIRRRFQIHRSKLKTGISHKVFQATYNEHGIDPFRFVILERIPGEFKHNDPVLLEFERHWFNVYPNCLGTQGDLTDEDIRSIRARRKAGDTLKSIGDDFGISHVNVHHICSGRSYSHVV